jgi:IS30 family transposase
MAGARVLGRHPSTIRRESNSGGRRKAYRATIPQVEVATRASRRCRNVLAGDERLGAVLGCLQERCSPDAIRRGFVLRGKERVNAETIRVEAAARLAEAVSEGKPDPEHGARRARRGKFLGV